MAFTPGNIALYSINTIDVSAYIEKASMDIKSPIQNLPRLGSNGTAHLVSPPDIEFSVDFWLDPTLTAILKPLAYNRPAVTCTIVYEPEGAGGDSRTATCYVSDYHEESDAKNPNKGTCKLTTSDGVLS